MRPRVLISDSDWRLLAFAFSDLRNHGFEVMIEPSAAAALELAERWRPDVVIASKRILSEWERMLGSGLTPPLGEAAVVVTIGADEADEAWQPLLDRGFDVLPKPLVHPSELRAAMEVAVSSIRGEPGGIGPIVGPGSQDGFGNEAARRGTA